MLLTGLHKVKQQRIGQLHECPRATKPQSQETSKSSASMQLERHVSVLALAASVLPAVYCPYNWEHDDCALGFCVCA